MDLRFLKVQACWNSTRYFAPGGDHHRVPITLATLEFMRRWCLHIWPKGYTKTRSFGGWHNRRRDAYLERCAIQLEAIDAPLPEDAFEFPASLNTYAAEPRQSLHHQAQTQ